MAKSSTCGHVLPLFVEADEMCVECFEQYGCFICGQPIRSNTERSKTPWGALQHKVCGQAAMDARAAKAATAKPSVKK